MLNLKGFSESDGQVNPVLDPGRYYGTIKKVEEKEWQSGKGSTLKVQFIAEENYNEDEAMPAWAVKNGAYVFVDFPLPNPEEYPENGDWCRSCVAKIKNIYNACDVTDVDEDELDPAADLTGKQCIALLTINRGGEEESNGKKYYKAQHNEVREFFKIPTEED